jgi:hypothetical protein
VLGVAGVLGGGGGGGIGVSGGGGGGVCGVSTGIGAGSGLDDGGCATANPAAAAQAPSVAK